MAFAIDTNVLVRLLIDDDARQAAAARALLRRAELAGESLLVLNAVLLECEWVLRSRYKLAPADIAQAFAALLETEVLNVEDLGVIEEALSLWGQLPRAGFADCLHCASAMGLGLQFATFDVGASKLPGALLVPPA